MFFSARPFPKQVRYQAAPLPDQGIDSKLHVVDQGFSRGTSKHMQDGNEAATWEHTVNQWDFVGEIPIESLLGVARAF